MRYGDPQLDRELRAENTKAGRWRRRLFIVAAAMLVAIVGWGILAAVTTPTVEAQSPSPSPTTEGQRVEVAEDGYAVTFPEDWVIEIVEEDSDTAILVLSGPERFGPDVELQNLVVAWGPEGQQRETLNACTLVRYQPIELTADEFLDEIHGQSDSIVVESLREGLSRVLVNQFFQSRVLSDPEARYSEVYAIGADGVVAILWCSGKLPHRGDWLSIAKTIEFLPIEE